VSRRVGCGRGTYERGRFAVEVLRLIRRRHDFDFAVIIQRQKHTTDIVRPATDSERTTFGDEITDRRGAGTARALHNTTNRRIGESGPAPLMDA
jgi:hypothetical protein